MVVIRTGGWQKKKKKGGERNGREVHIENAIGRWGSGTRRRGAEVTGEKQRSIFPGPRSPEMTTRTEETGLYWEGMGENRRKRKKQKD